MATDTLKAGIPIISIDSGYQVVFEAISPTTGLPITGVVVSGVTVYGDDLSQTDNVVGDTVQLTPALLPG